MIDIGFLKKTKKAELEVDEVPQMEPRKKKLPKERKERPEHQDLNTEKDEYKMSKAGLRKVLRIVFWVILITFFIKGVFVSLRKDPTDEINRTIQEFKNNWNNNQARETEILAFAQNFTREYLTYTGKNEAEFIKRITPYVSQNVLRNNFSFSNSAEAVYVQAYKIQDYSNYQKDVFVLADVSYQAPAQTSEQIILKVPVASIDGHYIIEDLPVFVNDNIKIAQYANNGVSGTDIGTDETNAVKKSLANFFKSYYEDEQNVINYYLTKDANPSDFMGLNGRVKFGEIKNIKCHSTADSLEIICIVTVSAVDKNGVAMPQNYNLRLIKLDNMYYIKSMETRTSNLADTTVAVSK